MTVGEIVASLDDEIARLQQVRSLLSDGKVGVAPTSSNGLVRPRPAKKHTMSAEGRARIAAAQKARWAKQKKAAKK
jgi:hypothetical protein